MLKLGLLRDGAEEPAVLPDGYVTEDVSGTARLRITCAGGYAELVHMLASRLRPPYRLLYVLLVPRGGSAPGRYESPELDGAELAEFFSEFGAFWSEDARHHIWVHSRPDDATIVWDRHGLIYAYGPLQLFEASLAERAIMPSVRADVPAPHVHYYHPEWDDAERALVAGTSWILKPLGPHDEAG